MLCIQNTSTGVTIHTGQTNASLVFFLCKSSKYCIFELFVSFEPTYAVFFFYTRSNLPMRLKCCNPGLRSALLQLHLSMPFQESFTATEIFLYFWCFFFFCFLSFLGFGLRRAWNSSISRSLVSLAKTKKIEGTQCPVIRDEVLTTLWWDVMRNPVSAHNIHACNWRVIHRYVLHANHPSLSLSLSPAGSLPVFFFMPGDMGVMDDWRCVPRRITNENLTDQLDQ